MGIEAAHHKAKIYVYNATKEPVVLYHYIIRGRREGFPKPVVIEPKKAPRKLSGINTRNIFVEKGNEPTEKLNREYDLSDLFKGIDGDRVMIVENDLTHPSGLKVHALSKEEFDKTYSETSVAGAEECPTFPVLPGASAFSQEERKVSAAVTE
jgi:hypothetical protein